MRIEMAAALLITEKAPALAASLAALECEGDDARHHLAFLSTALEFSRRELFTRYAAWAAELLAHRPAADAGLVHHLQCMERVLASSLPAEHAQAALAYIRAAIDAAPREPLASSASSSSAASLAPLAGRYLALLLQHDDRAARRLALDELRHGMGAGELYLQVLAPAMHEVGRLWQANRLSVAEEHYCAGVTQGVVGEISGSLRAVRGNRTAVVACVAGEQHALGSRMVADFLDMTGWRTLWLGASTPSSDMLRMVCDLGAEVLAVSCTYAPHLHDVASLVSAVRALPECRHVKVMVGGHAFSWSEHLWKDVGADGYAPDAARAAQLAHQLTGTRAPAA